MSLLSDSWSFWTCYSSFKEEEIVGANDPFNKDGVLVDDDASLDMVPYTIPRLS